MLAVSREWGMAFYALSCEPSKMSRFTQREGMKMNTKRLTVLLTALFCLAISSVAHANQPPELTAISAQTNAEGETVTLQPVTTDPDGDVLVYSAMGLPPELVMNSSTGEISGRVSFNSAGVYPVTVCASDGSLLDCETFPWTITDTNRQPAVISPGNQTNAEGDTVALATLATDPDADALTYSALALPPELVINAITGLITGTLPCTSAGVYLVTVAASDGFLTASTTFAWTITEACGDTTLPPPPAPDPNPTPGPTPTPTPQPNPANRPPAISPMANQTNAEGDTVALQVLAADPDFDVLVYSAVGLPQSLTLHPATGEITGTLPCTSAGAYLVTVAASDGFLTASTPFAWTITEACGDTTLPPPPVPDPNPTPEPTPPPTDANQPPVIVSPGDQTSPEGVIVILQVVASDPDGDLLTYSATGLLPGLSLNSTTGLIAGTVSFDSAGVYTVTVCSQDAGGLSSCATFIWTIINTSRPPVVIPPGDQSSLEGVVVSLQVLATDPDVDALTFSAMGLPPALSLNTTGLITGTLSCESAGTYAVTVIVSDGIFMTSTTFIWTVLEACPLPPPPPPAENQPPVVTDPGPQTSAEGDVVSLQIVATDPDGDLLSFNATGLLPGLVINPTGSITGTLFFGSAGVYAITVCASDGSLSSCEVFTWTITDTNRPPVITSPADQTSAEGDTVALALAVSDPDGDALTFSVVGLPAGLTIHPAAGLITGTLSCESAGVYSVTAMVSDGILTDATTFVWTVTEACGGPPPPPPPPTVVTCDGKPVTILGTEGNDVIRGTDGPDVIHGLGGNDWIHGGKGDDVICGGNGNDHLIGGAGHDFLLGGRGNDILSGDEGTTSSGRGKTRQSATDVGNDRLMGGSGNDVCQGDGGSDRYRGCEKRKRR
jgi:uncharacterized protein YuzB (UPF0349 family)